MDEFNVNIKCKCGSDDVVVYVSDIYEGDIILTFYCNECDVHETWGVENKIYY